MKETRKQRLSRRAQQVGKGLNSRVDPIPPVDLLAVAFTMGYKEAISDLKKEFYSPHVAVSIYSQNAITKKFLNPIR